MTRASIIVVSWNGQAYLKDCLDSIWLQLGLDDEVIVVDNASTDGSAALVRGGYPRVHLIENEHNLGFAGGANRGLEVAQGNILVLINQDVVLCEGCLEALYHRLIESGPGIVGSKLLYPDGKTIQHAGGIICLPRGVSDHRGYRQIDDGRWNSVEQVDYVTGAVFAFDRTVLCTVGRFDQKFYPAYYEEVDYCYRARTSGFAVLYEPNAVALHHETQSQDIRSVAYHQAMQRGRLRFVLKNFNKQQLADFFLAERDSLCNLPPPFARQVMALAYFHTLLNMPRLSAKEESDTLNVLERMCELYSLARQSPRTRKTVMNSESQYLELPEIREHDFQSRVPVIGPVIQLVRRTLYQLTAKWSVIVVIDQQNRINQMFAQYLRELDGRLRELDNQLREHGDQLRDIDDRLIEQDRDLAYLARVVAELEIQQRHLAQLSLPQTYSEPQSTSGE